MSTLNRGGAGVGLGLAAVVCCGGKALLLAGLAGGSLGALAGWAGAIAGAAVLVTAVAWYVRRRSLSPGHSGGACCVPPVESRPASIDGVELSEDSRPDASRPDPLRVAP